MWPKQKVWMCSTSRWRTTLSGRHCTLKQGHNVCVTLSKVQTRHTSLKIQFTPQSALAFHYVFNREERVSQKLSLMWVCMITVRIRDRYQHCGTGSSSQVENWRQMDRCRFFVFRRYLSVLQQQKGNHKHLISKATVHCVCPVSPRYNSQKAKLCSAHSGQIWRLKWHNRTALL